MKGQTFEIFKVEYSNVCEEDKSVLFNHILACNLMSSIIIVRLFLMTLKAGTYRHFEYSKLECLRRSLFPAEFREVNTRYRVIDLPQYLLRVPQKNLTWRNEKRVLPSTSPATSVRNNKNLGDRATTFWMVKRRATISKQLNW